MEVLNTFFEIFNCILGKSELTFYMVEIYSKILIETFVSLSFRRNI